MAGKPQYSRFESELIVRPDDIDMNHHVHNSRYLDYVLAARYDQMGRCYKMPMEQFIKMGLGWVVKSCFIEFKRPLVLGDTIIVRTWIEEIGGSNAKVRFEILKKETDKPASVETSAGKPAFGLAGKLASDGYFEYSMVNLSTGRAETIPQHIIKRYII